jgi:hypothetical protein
VYTNCFECQDKNNLCTQHVLNLYFSCNSMNNLLSYNGLIDAKMSTSDKDLPVCATSIRIGHKQLVIHCQKRSPESVLIFFISIFRLLIDSEDFSSVDNCSDVALLTSLFKLFLREIHEPLIPDTVQHKFAEVFKAGNQKPAFAELRKTMETEMPPTELRVLKYLFTHLRRVADEPKNMMNTRNVAVVFAPNILHSAAVGNRRPASLLSEAEMHNGIVEGIIEQFTDIFPK